MLNAYKAGVAHIVPNMGCFSEVAHSYHRTECQHIVRVIHKGKLRSPGDVWPEFWTKQKPYVFEDTYSWKRAIGMGLPLLCELNTGELPSWLGGDACAFIPDFNQGDTMNGKC